MSTTALTRKLPLALLIAAALAQIAVSGAARASDAATAGGAPIVLADESTDKPADYNGDAPPATAKGVAKTRAYTTKRTHDYTGQVKPVGPKKLARQPAYDPSTAKDYPDK